MFWKINLEQGVRQGLFSPQMFTALVPQN